MLTESSSAVIIIQHIPQRPKTICGDIADPPTALEPLCREARWVNWRWQWNPKNRKWTKPPFRTDDPARYARNNDPTTWGDRHTAVKAVLAGKADGIGYCLDGSDIAAIDLDKCRDPATGDIADWARDIIDAALNAYCEVTVSGEGLRIIGTTSGVTETHRRFSIDASAGIEIFRRAVRYITVSGLQLGDCKELPNIDQLVDDLVARYDAVQEPQTNNSQSSEPLGDISGDIAYLIQHGAPNGTRSQAFARVIWSLAAQGHSSAEIAARLAAYPNGIAAKFINRLEVEVERCYQKWKLNDTQPKETVPKTPRTLDEVHDVFKKWFGAEFDTATVDAVAAAGAVERLSGDPLWLLIISGSGNTKTETVQSLAGAGAHVTSTITSEGALLSASPQKNRAKTATGGLLRKIGDSGILVIKDVTSILSADRNTRAGVLAALREVYDGRWERNVGSDGGQTLSWTGRIAVVGAVTTAWDVAHAVIAVMGDRFIVIRSDSTTGRSKAGRQAIRNTGTEAAMRAELAAAVGGLIDAVDANAAWVLTEDEIDRLVKAADIVTYARTAVERDYRGDVVDAHAPEMPTRFAKQLAQMVRGSLAIGMNREVAILLALRCARDSIPQLRLEILLDIAANPRSRAIDVCHHINKPLRTVRRELEGLHVLGLLGCDEEPSAVDENKTIWRYSLTPEFDCETLLTMAGLRRSKPGAEK